MKNSNINLEALEKMAAEKANEARIKIGNVSVSVKTNLTLDEIYSICSVLSQAPASVTGKGLQYLPSALLMVYKVGMVKTFCPDLVLPDDPESSWLLINQLNLFEKIKNALKGCDIIADCETLYKAYDEHHRLNASGINFVNKQLTNIDIEKLSQTENDLERFMLSQETENNEGE